MRFINNTEEIPWNALESPESLILFNILLLTFHFIAINYTQKQIKYETAESKKNANENSFVSKSIFIIWNKKIKFNKFNGCHLCAKTKAPIFFTYKRFRAACHHVNTEHNGIWSRMLSSVPHHFPCCFLWDSSQSTAIFPMIFHIHQQTKHNIVLATPSKQTVWIRFNKQR